MSFQSVRDTRKLNAGQRRQSAFGYGFLISKQERRTETITPDKQKSLIWLTNQVWPAGFSFHNAAIVFPDMHVRNVGAGKLFVRSSDSFHISNGKQTSSPQSNSVHAPHGPAFPSLLSTYS